MQEKIILQCLIFLLNYRLVALGYLLEVGRKLADYFRFLQLFLKLERKTAPMKLFAGVEHFVRGLK